MTDYETTRSAEPDATPDPHGLVSLVMLGLIVFGLLAVTVMIALAS